MKAASPYTILPRGFTAGKLHRELLNRGIYLGPSGYEVGFISSAHTKTDLEKAKRAIFDSLDLVFNGK